MYGHSGMMIMVPRIPTILGRSTSGFHRPGRTCLHQARRAVRCWARLMNGELHHVTQEPLLRPPFLHWMTRPTKSWDRTQVSFQQAQWSLGLYRKSCLGFQWQSCFEHSTAVSTATYVSWSFCFQPCLPATHVHITAVG